ncbi:MAG: large subunit ribosomal protein [Patescibacteria group bacterium]|nr:large subunit ribosomal protein [Patescibacteria group bacterium]
MKLHIKKGDKVRVITGDDKGKEGTIVRVLPELGRVIIEGVNVMKKNIKPKKEGEKGTIVEVAMPMHASNVKKI